jgi:4-hydroxybenzoate polyprenyltransferase
MMMDTIGRIAQLIRLPNLAIILLTQVLLRYCILKPYLFAGTAGVISGTTDFFLLVLITLLIAAGGYVINDYFDVQVDSVNDPGKNSVGAVFSENTIVSIHWLLNGIAVVLGFYLAFRLKSWIFGLTFPVLSLLLYFYSLRYKKILLLGNVVVSALSALVILIVWYFEFLHLQLQPENFIAVLGNLKLTTNYFLSYALFAFLISMAREIIKDMEDIKGDIQNSRNTLPVVLGWMTTKIVAAVLILALFVVILYCCWIAFTLSQMMVLLYLLATIEFPLIYLLVKLFRSGSREEFHFLSGICKIIMVAGILTMQLISIVN